MSRFDAEYYSYQEIAAAAVKDGATLEEKERLARWLDTYAPRDGWDGERYKVDRIKGDPRTYYMEPIYAENPDDPDDFITVDYKIY